MKEDIYAGNQNVPQYRMTNGKGNNILKSVKVIP